MTPIVRVACRGADLVPAPRASLRAVYHARDDAEADRRRVERGEHLCARSLAPQWVALTATDEETAAAISDAVDKLLGLRPSEPEVDPADEPIGLVPTLRVVR